MNTTIDLQTGTESKINPHITTVYTNNTNTGLNNLELNITKLESSIQEFIYNDNKCFCTFKYCNVLDSYIELKVYTTNPIHNEIFLMTKSIEKTKELCLGKTLLYLKKMIKSKKMFTYMVEWRHINHDKNTISYFNVNGLPELIEKFYKEEDKNIYDYYIYNISKRPES